MKNNVNISLNAFRNRKKPRKKPIRVNFKKKKRIAPPSKKKVENYKKDYVVIDYGSSNVRTGFGGSESVYRNYRSFSWPSDNRFGMNLGLKGGKKELKSPISRGEVKDWAKIHHLLNDCYGGVYMEGGRLKPSDSHTFLVQKPFVTKKTKQRIFKLMFGKIGVGHLYLGDSASCSLYANGKTSGLCVESGFDLTQVSPVIDGVLSTENMYQGKFGGIDITLELEKILKKNKVQLSNFSMPMHMMMRHCLPPPPPEGLDVVNQIKTCGYIAENYDVECMKHAYQKNITSEIPYEKKFELLYNNFKIYKPLFHLLPKDCVWQVHEYFYHVKKVDYMMPDEEMIQFDTECFIPEELLFQPRLFDLEKKKQDGIPQMLSKVYKKSKRKELYSSVVVTGGNSQFKGFKERVFHEVVKSSGRKEGEVSVSNKHVEKAPLIGGALISGLGSFDKMWISKKDYKEIGSSIVDRKLNLCKLK